MDRAIRPAAGRPSATPHTPPRPYHISTTSHPIPTPFPPHSHLIPTSSPPHPHLIPTPFLPLPTSDECALVRAHADPTAQYELLIKHLEALRKHACFRRSLIVLVPESNLGFEAQHIMLAVQRHPIEGCIPLVAGANGGIGFHTTKDTKAAMCKLLQELLQYDRLHVIRDVVSVGMTPESALDMLHTELGRFAIILEPPRSVFGAPRYTFSGKLGGQQDDLAVTLQIALLGARIFRTRPQYSHLRGMRTGTVSGHH